MKEIIIGIDVDNVVADFTKLFIYHFNSLTNETLKRSDLIDWNFKNAINDLYNGKIDGNIANQILLEDNFFSDLILKDNVIEGLLKISKNKNTKLKFVTALNPDKESIRTNWLKEKLKGIDYSVVYEHKKDKVEMDYLIDDGVHNLDMLKDIIGKDNCLCIAEPYNINCEYNRFNNLNEAISYILQKENLE